MAIALAQAQVATGLNTTGGTTASLTTQATGSSFLICVGYENNSGTDPFTSVSDSKSNVYVQVDSTRRNGISNAWGRVYLCANGVGGSGHTATLAFAPGANSGFHVIIAEVTGGALSGTLDVAVGAVITAGSTIITPTLTAVASRALVCCYVSDSGSANPSTHTFDNSLVKPTNGEALDGTSYHVGALAAKAVTSGFSAAITVSVSGTTPPAGIIGFTLKELTASSGNLLLMGCG